MCVEINKPNYVIIPFYIFIEILLYKYLVYFRLCINLKFKKKAFRISMLKVK